MVVMLSVSGVGIISFIKNNFLFQNLDTYAYGVTSASEYILCMIEITELNSVAHAKLGLSTHEHKIERKSLK